LTFYLRSDYKVNAIQQIRFPIQSTVKSENKSKAISIAFARRKKTTLTQWFNFILLKNFILGWEENG